MNIMLARQPILDRNEHVFGYELVFEKDLKTLIQDVKTQVEEMNLSDEGLDFWPQLLGFDKPSFIQIDDLSIFRDDSLFEEFSTLIFMVADDVEVDEKDREHIAALKKKGNRFSLLGLDHMFSGHPLVQDTSMIQVSMNDLELGSPNPWVENYHERGFEVLVRDVESHEAFQWAKKQGADFFKGSYFKTPTLVAEEPLSVNQLSYFQLLKEIRQPHLQFHRLESIIERDATLTLKLIQYINSSHFGMRFRIRSVKHGLSLLGEDEIKKWATMVIVSLMSRSKPEELMVTALVRAHFCEEMAGKTGQGNLKAECFFLGLISVLDAMLNQTMEHLLKQFPVSSLIAEALLGSNKNQMSLLLQLILSYEDANWFNLADHAQRLRIDEDEVVLTYLNSLEFADKNLEV